MTRASRQETGMDRVIIFDTTARAYLSALNRLVQSGRRPRDAAGV